MEDFAEGMLMQVYPGKFGERKVGQGRDDASLAVRWITYVIRIIPSLETRVWTFPALGMNLLRNSGLR